MYCVPLSPASGNAANKIRGHNTYLPATWRLADRLWREFDGARYPSALYAGGVNLVLGRWNESGGPTVAVLGPTTEL